MRSEVRRFLVALLVLAALVLMGSMCSCSPAAYADSGVTRFEVEGYYPVGGGTLKVVEDTETGVQYVMGYDGGICPLLNRYGRPYVEGR